MKRASTSSFTRVAAVSLSLLLILTLFPLNPVKAYATDPAKGIEVREDASKLEASVAAAKAAGVDVQKDDDVDKGSVESSSDIDAKKSEIQDDYNKQSQDLDAITEEAKQKLADYATKKAAYDTAKAKYDADKAQYDADKAQYDADMIAYNKAMAELEQKKNEDGYMTKPYPQLLTFKSEPNAVLTLSGRKYTHDEFSAEVRSWNLGSEPWRYSYFDALNNGQAANAARVMLEKDKPFTATYTNLTNSSYNGKKISKVVYTYTYKGSSGVNVPNKLPVVLQKDPTVTIWYNDFFGDARINVTVKFYDEDGNVIDPTGSLLSFSSLNRGNGSGAVDKDAIEKAGYFNGEYVPISGSTIKPHGDGSAYSDTNNAEKAYGSRFNTADWDTPTSPKAWYGAIVGRVTSPEISFDMASHKSGIVWFALNSDIKAINVPTKPVEPTPPTPPAEEPEKPTFSARYHLDVFYVKPQLEKKALSEDDKDINSNTVKTNSVVKFALNTTPFPAGHEKINSVVFHDVLPEGYEVNLEDTKKASPDYEVSYDEGTRTLVFTANASLLSQINADPTKEADVPAPVIVGKVTKDGAVYENDFDIDINNTYTRSSNKVTVKTPEPPNPPKKRKKKAKTPYTGDAGVFSSIALCAGSIAVLGGSWFIKKKKK